MKKIICELKVRSQTKIHKIHAIETMKLGKPQYNYEMGELHK